MKRIFTFSAILILILAASTTAFDGRRRGLIVGGGVGIAPAVRWSTDYMGKNYSESKAAFGEQILAGYGWDEHNVMALEVNLAGYKSDVFDCDLIQGFGGLSWYHYFGTPGKTFFSVAGLGVYRFVRGWGINIDINFNSVSDQPPLPDGASGPGYLIGGGYEFTRHVQIEVYFSGGKTSERQEDYSHSQLGLLLTGLIY